MRPKISDDTFRRMYEWYWSVHRDRPGNPGVDFNDALDELLNEVGY